MGISLACDVTDESSFNNKYYLYFLTYSLIGSILGRLMQLSKARKLKLIKFSNFSVNKLLHHMSFLLALKSLFNCLDSYHYLLYQLLVLLNGFEYHILLISYF